MVHVRTLLDTRRARFDGSFNIIYRITHYKKVYTLSSGISVHTNHWNSHSSEIDRIHPNAARLNLKLSKRFFEIQRAILELEDHFSIEELKALLEGKPKQVEEPITFKTFSDKLIKNMHQINKSGNALIYQTAVNRFLAFCGNPNILFNEINYTLLEQFSHSLAIQGLKVNSISNYFRTLRAIYNKAIKQKVVERTFYPFYDLKIKSERTLKRAVLRQDIAKLEQLDLSENKPAKRALDSFLLSFYLIGISFTDMAYLTNKNVIEGRIVYRRRKTHKEYSIKLFPQAKAILESFYQEDSKYLIPILPNNVVEDSLRAKKLIHQWIKTTNKYIKRMGIDVGIPAPLTTYVARHTFATTAKKLGYSNELIAEALGHEYGNKITNIYLDSFDSVVVDEMHLHVIAPLDKE
ncbi:site-specific integrase [Daejeonella sp.]|jgi:integrase/recombinase XerD|uniref:site-specific integrase n=1 Tax=Daejeonella sp. TaxID=2805397 RepID=UPI0037BFA1ED